MHTGVTERKQEELGHSVHFKFLIPFAFVVPFEFGWKSLLPTSKLVGNGPMVNW